MNGHEPRLTAAEMELLEFERATWRSQGRREAVILERFGTSLTRHTQRVLHLLENPAALAYDAATVNRLRRLCNQRAHARSTGMSR